MAFSSDGGDHHVDRSTRKFVGAEDEDDASSPANSPVRVAAKDPVTTVTTEGDTSTSATDPVTAKKSNNKGYFAYYSLKIGKYVRVNNVSAIIQLNKKYKERFYTSVENLVQWSDWRSHLFWIGNTLVLGHGWYFFVCS